MEKRASLLERWNQHRIGFLVSANQQLWSSLPFFHVRVFEPPTASSCTNEENRNSGLREIWSGQQFFLLERQREPLSLSFLFRLLKIKSGEFLKCKQPASGRTRPVGLENRFIGNEKERQLQLQRELRLQWFFGDIQHLIQESLMEQSWKHQSWNSGILHVRTILAESIQRVFVV